jgi:hypothetical protein
MTISTALKTVNIRPNVSVLSVFPHLNYKPWYALAEFVDNALQSYLANRDTLEAVEGTDFKLRVDIELDPTDKGQLIIRDNAAGINELDYERAFKTASVPSDRSGLSEFGVGMKSAACWFARSWSVRTTAINEDVERSISFDVESIVRDSIEEISLSEVVVPHRTHYTEIVLRDLHSIPQGRTVAKIKEHIASIYRIFLRERSVVIRFNGEPLRFEEPEILTASYFKNDLEPPKLWRKDVELDFGGGLRVYGFAALRATASTSSAGFALFRRKRLIQGSGDEGYRPERVFKKSNSYTYQRLFGELHVEGFDVSHTKDGFRWAEYEDIFLDFLKEALNTSPLSLLDQAEGYRVRPKPADVKQYAQAALDSTAKVIESEVPPVLEQQLQSKPKNEQPPSTLSKVTTVTERVVEFETDGCRWQILIELTTDPAVGDWLSISDQITTEDSKDGLNTRRLGIRLAMAHPFMERFAGSSLEGLEPLLRVAAAMALAETTARQGGVPMSGIIRMYVNNLLRSALSKP